MTTAQPFDIEQVGIPLQRARESLTEGAYIAEGNKLIPQTPNPRGYQGDTPPTPSWLTQYSRQMYLENIGSLSYLHASPHSFERLSSLKLYLESIEADHFYNAKFTVPGGYWVNMFHLLNPGHENSIHTFSLDGIKVERALSYTPTQYGGEQVVLSRMLDVSRITTLQDAMKRDPLLRYVAEYIAAIRQEEFESVSILHGPFVVEQRIPLGDGKYTAMLFSLSPVDEGQCKLFIDCYSNLEMPHSIKWFLFHLIAPIVVQEDVGYLRRLSRKGSEFFRTVRRPVDDRHFLRLHQRFLELYA